MILKSWKLCTSLFLLILVFIGISCSDGGSDNGADVYSPFLQGSFEKIDGDHDNSASDPQIASNGNGNAIAVWEQDYENKKSIWANRFNGSIWGTAERIDSGNLSIGGCPQIAVDTDGNAIAIWVQGNDVENTQIWVNRFDGSAWSVAERVQSNNSDYVGCPQITFITAGKAMAVWTQYTDNSQGIYALQFE